MHRQKKTIPCKEWINKQSNQDLVRRLEKYSSVMKDPNKVKIVLLLDQYNKHDDGTRAQLYVSDLAEHIGISLSAVSHSLRVLEHRGFVTKERHGQSSRYYLSVTGNELVAYFNMIQR